MQKAIHCQIQQALVHSHTRLLNLIIIFDPFISCSLYTHSHLSPHIFHLMEYGTILLLRMELVSEWQEVVEILSICSDHIGKFVKDILRTFASTMKQLILKLNLKINYCTIKNVKFERCRCIKMTVF